MNHPVIGLGGVPRAVWALGFVSLFMDMSSEIRTWDYFITLRTAATMAGACGKDASSR
jgi:hypothetical protein